ncbi:MAG: dienelactone hydrolase family protein [Candidatus Zhuqueibacterota bacterium]
MIESEFPKNKSKKYLLALVLVALLASYSASLIQRSWGRVQVHGIKIPTQNGQWLSADLFKPKSATKDNPAPLVVVVPGFQRSKESLSNISLELARRGIVVIAIDPYSQGGSSSSMSTNSATTEGYGMYAVVEYASSTPNLNYIDKSRIGATGHSAGGNAAIRGASYFGKKSITTGKPSKLFAVFVSGYMLSLTEDVLQDVRSNVGVSYALFDEGAYRNEMKNGDVRRAPEVIRLLNSSLAPGAPGFEEVKTRHYYGDAAERTLRVVHNERVLHPFQPYITEATANQIEYFEKVFGIESGLSSHNQIWYWKELLSMISLIAAFIALVPLGRLLLELPFFQALSHPMSKPQPQPSGNGKILFWSLIVIGALIACFSYIPMAEWSQKLFISASTRKQTWFFPQRMNNAVMLWAVLNGLFGFLMFFLSYRFHGKKHGVLREMWGAKISRSELGKTSALAVTIFLFYYLFLFTIYYFFHVDYRFLFMGVRVFQPIEIILLVMYVPFFLIFFVSNSLRVNGAMRIEGMAEWKSMLIAGLANSFGLLLIVIIQYLTFFITGTVYWTDGWLYVNLLFAVVPMMFVLPYFNRYFFRMTGRIYLGPLVTCFVFIMILLTNTVCYLPLQ